MYGLRGEGKRVLCGKGGGIIQTFSLHTALGKKLPWNLLVLVMMLHHLESLDCGRRNRLQTGWALLQQHVV